MKIPLPYSVETAFAVSQNSCEFIGLRINLGNGSRLMWADQAAMPGLRIGTHFSPQLNEEIIYTLVASSDQEPRSEGFQPSSLPPVAAGVSQPASSADADARDHHLTTATAHVAAGVSQPLKPVEFIQMVGEFRDIHWFNQQLQESQAKLIDRTAEAAQLAERAARLQHELDTSRSRETHLIQERDRLINQDLAKAHAELQITKEALASRRNENQELIGRIREIANYAKATAGV